ncbi:MAG: hypothetical protein MJZ99_01185 [Bacteroidales bacterium]|nr:hypothetical protein [Bacteroidales bacterium]
MRTIIFFSIFAKDKKQRIISQMARNVANTPILDREDSISFLKNVIESMAASEAQSAEEREKEKQRIEESYLLISSLAVDVQF